jgi:hypothetical protein
LKAIFTLFAEFAANEVKLCRTIAAQGKLKTLVDYQPNPEATSSNASKELSTIYWQKSL